MYMRRILPFLPMAHGYCSFCIAIQMPWPLLLNTRKRKHCDQYLDPNWYIFQKSLLVPRYMSKHAVGSYNNGGVNLLRSVKFYIKYKVMTRESCPGPPARPQPSLYAQWQTSGPHRVGGNKPRQSFVGPQSPVCQNWCIWLTRQFFWFLWDRMNIHILLRSKGNWNTRHRDRQIYNVCCNSCTDGSGDIQLLALE